MTSGLADSGCPDPARSARLFAVVSAGSGGGTDRQGPGGRTWERPFGQPVSTTITVMTWNLWGRLGPWPDRQAAISSTLRSVRPDVVLLQETWVERDGEAQTEVLAGGLGYHEVHGGETFLFSDDWSVAFGVLSRWPVAVSDVQPFDSAEPGTWGGSPAGAPPWPRASCCATPGRRPTPSTPATPARRPTPGPPPPCYPTAVSTTSSPPRRGAEGLAT